MIEQTPKELSQQGQDHLATDPTPDRLLAFMAKLFGAFTNHRSARDHSSGTPQRPGNLWALSRCGNFATGDRVDAWKAAHIGGLWGAYRSGDMPIDVVVYPDAFIQFCASTG